MIVVSSPCQRWAFTNTWRALSLVATMFANGSGRNEYSLQRIFHRCFLLSFTSFGWGVSEDLLKLLSQMNRNLVGSNYGRSSIKIAHFIPIRWQTWSPKTILVSVWPISNNLLLWNCLAKWVLSFTSFGWGVSEEKIKMWIVNGDRRRTKDDGRRPPSDGKSSHCLWQGMILYRTYNSFSLFAMQLDYCNIQRVFEPK
jgi:hypothetical protein